MESTNEIPNEETNFFSIECFNYKRENIHLIESRSEDLEKLKFAFEEINKSDIIGLDSEWVTWQKPVKTIIFQIATKDKGFVFDLDPLNVKLEEQNNFYNIFIDLLSEIFNNEKIIKVFWDFDLDLKNLNNRFASFTKNLKNIKNCVDLMRVAPKHIQRGFSNHCLYYLGKKLDKANQVCRWDERPLSDSKIVYAALDSIAAIPLYEKMRESGLEIILGELRMGDVLKRMYEYKVARTGGHQQVSDWEMPKKI